MHRLKPGRRRTDSSRGRIACRRIEAPPISPGFRFRRTPGSALRWFAQIHSPRRRALKKTLARSPGVADHLTLAKPMNPAIQAQIKKYLNEELRPMIETGAFLVFVGVLMSFAAWAATYAPFPYDLLPRRLITENYVPATLIITTVVGALFGGLAFIVAYQPQPVTWKRQWLFWISDKIANFAFGLVSVCYGLVIAAFIKRVLWGIDPAGVPANFSDVRSFLLLPLYAAYFAKAPSGSLGMRKFSVIMGVFCIGLAMLLFYFGSQGAGTATKKRANQSLEPTATAVTPHASQKPRRP